MHFAQSPSLNQFPVVNTTVAPSQPWIFDSGASHHATSNLDPLQTFTKYGGPDEIRLGDGKSLQISHIGHNILPLSSSALSLKNILCAPKLCKNLISISQSCRTNPVSVEFFPSYFLVKDLRTGASLLQGEEH